MIISEIEINNFKSYEGLTKIVFDSCFSGIIGSNGSGKSNIMDAICFIFNINNSLLRCHLLQDYVNNNTTKDQSNTYCLMRLTEGDRTLELKREIVNAKKSVVSVDKKVLNLKDYTKLLEEYNIYNKVLNFVILQGEIDKIKVKNNKEITRTIEEISGSLELKKEYEELQRKKEKEIENLNYIINKKKIFYREQNVANESNKEAKKLVGFIEEKEELEKKQLLAKLYMLDKEYEENSHNLSKELETIEKIKEKEYKETASNKKQISKQINISRLDKIKLEKSLNDLNEKIKINQNNNVALVQKNIELNKKTQTKLQAKLTNMQNNQLDVIQNRINALNEKIQHQHSIRKDLVAQSTKASHSALLDSEPNKSEFQQLSTEFKNKSIVLEIQVNNINNKIVVNENIVKDNLMLVEQLKSKASKLTSQMQQLLNNKAQINSALTTSQIAQLNQQLTEKRNQKDSNDLKLKELSEKLTVVLNSILETSSSMISTEKELKTVQLVQTLKNMYKGVYGRVCNLIKSKNDKYELSLSVILSKNKDSIVVDSEQTALNCIKYVKDQRIGVFKFIPVESLKLNSVPSYNNNFLLPSGIKYAKDCVLCRDNSIGSAVLAYVCLGYLISENEELALEYAKSSANSHNIVALNGTVIHKSGFMTGGVVENAKTSTLQNNSIEELNDLKTRRNALLKQLEKIKQESNLSEEIIELENALSKKITENDSNLAKTNEINQAIDDLKKELLYIQETRMNEILANNANINKTIQTIQSQAKQTTSQIEQIKEGIFGAFIQRLKINMETLDQLLNLKNNKTLNNKIIESDYVLANLSKQLHYETNSLELLQTNIKNTSATVQRIQLQLDEHNQTLLSLTQANAANEKQLSVITNKLLYNNELLNQLKTDSSTLNHTLNKLDNIINDHLINVNLFESVLLSLFAKRVELMEQYKILNNMKLPLKPNHSARSMEPDNQTSIKFNDLPQIDYSDLIKEFKAIDSHTLVSIQDSIAELTTKINRLKPLLSLSKKYDSINKEYMGIEKEYDQIRAQTMKTRDRFNAIRNQRLKLFMDAFNFISKNIDSVYKQLTKDIVNDVDGGSAYLTLENAQEPFNEGTKYSAIPPMKRYDLNINIEKLSGGERTLAAVALLFTINMYKKPPFIILDEVCSALDNSNLVKLIAFIKEYNAKHKMQFLIISLKPILFEKANLLIGVHKSLSKNNGTSSSIVTHLNLSKYHVLNTSDMEQEH